MDGFNTYEYRTEQKAVGKYKTYKILLLILYIAFAAGFFGVMYYIRLIPLVSLLPLFVWMLEFFTWKYTKPDYKYSIEAGALTFSVYYGKKGKDRCKIKLSEAVAIAPRAELKEQIKDFSPKKIYNALSNEADADAYAILFNDGGVPSVFYFIATADGLKLLHFYNSKTVKRTTRV